MRWVRYRSDGKTSYGILHGNTIEEVYGTPFDSYINSGMVHLYEEVELLPPVIPPTCLLYTSPRPRDVEQSRNPG